MKTSKVSRMQMEVDPQTYQIIICMEGQNVSVIPHLTSFVSFNDLRKCSYRTEKYWLRNPPE
eukprot:scaffold191184_cov26-Tisochrysis_lutea.AAC.3